MTGPTEHRFRGTLTERDVKRHIPHVIDVPAPATGIRVQLGFEPAVVAGHRNMICLTLFDPAGFRGAGHRHGNRHVVEIGRDAATPGFLPGPLPAGQWVVQLDTHMVMPGTPCRYELTAVFDHDEVPPTAASRPPAPRFERIVERRAGWYRGDLHAHTVHSDGAWEVADLVAAARARGLDFVTLTDHNTTSGLAAMARCAVDGLLTMGGQELTTFWGHALCLGGHAWHDWRVTRKGPEMAALADRISAAGGLYVIAHPRNEGDPHCTGCRWLYPAMMPGEARLVEVWNGEWVGGERQRDKNEAALRLWYEWLNRGHRMVATAGTDVHGPGQQYQSRSAGFNVVYADQLSEAGILRGVAAGHLYLSAGPTLSFAALHEASGQRIMGDSLTVADKSPRSLRDMEDHENGAWGSARWPPFSDQSAAVSLAVSWDGVPEAASVRLIADGSPRDSLPIAAAGTREWSVAGNAAARWYVVEVRARDGAMLALTNPIFFDWE